jgi:hypothetical protein
MYFYSILPLESFALIWNQSCLILFVNDSSYK